MGDGRTKVGRKKNKLLKFSFKKRKAVNLGVAHSRTNVCRCTSWSEETGGFLVTMKGFLKKGREDDVKITDEARANAQNAREQKTPDL